MPRRADLADDGEHDVLGGAAAPQRAFDFTSMFLLFLGEQRLRASTCSTSEVPMPCASAPNAPCVLVCESPQTTVMPATSRLLRPIT
ncbi:hypothetical protein ACH51_06625 [Ralstonia solanacearum]|nr:hypothetical protein ACH51_06625 [Ralstonia solanacearum]